MERFWFDWLNFIIPFVLGAALYGFLMSSSRAHADPKAPNRAVLNGGSLAFFLAGTIMVGLVSHQYDPAIVLFSSLEVLAALILVVAGLRRRRAAAAA